LRSRDSDIKLLAEINKYAGNRRKKHGTSDSSEGLRKTRHPVCGILTPVFDKEKFWSSKGQSYGLSKAVLSPAHGMAKDSLFLGNVPQSRYG
jgi:hypothetical protein